MASSASKLVLAAAAAAVLCVSSAASAQWVLLARHVVGRIQSISQQTQDGKTQFDTATVIVDVPLDKVYATVKRSLQDAQAREGITVNRSDDEHRTIAFYRGAQAATISAAALGDNLTQLMVSSVRPGTAGTDAATQAPTPLIVERILATCKAMGVECSAAPTQ
ncbi:MAG: hypothetical protein JSR18_01330 [Proteobacteria bacterium]|nr:hypothetical protein [Pseudomonadota bacterium]